MEKVNVNHILEFCRRAKLKLLVSQTQPKIELQGDKENTNEDTNTSKSKKREHSEERIPSPKKE